MTLNEFINKYNGKAIDFDGAYGNQCVDLMNQYLIDCLGIGSPIQTLPGGTAFEIYQNASSPLFDKIDNTPTGVPQAGDILFWNTTIGSAGHVAVFVSGDTNNFTSFDQNWPVGSLCHSQPHDYNGVAGWLHPKSTPQGMVQVDSTKFAELVGKSTKYDAFNAAGFATIDDVTKKVGGVTNDLTNALKDRQTASDQAASLAGELQKIHQDDSSTAGQLLDAQHQVTQLQGQIDQVVKITNSQTFDEAVQKITNDEKSHKELVKNVQPVIDNLGDAAIYKKAPKPKTSQVTAVVNYLRSVFHL